MDVHDLQTGQTESWTSDDPAPDGPIAYAISGLFYDDKRLQQKLQNIIDTHDTKGQDLMPGLDKRRSIGQEVDADAYVDSGKKTQAAMDKMKKGVAEGSLNELAPSPGFGGDDDDDKYTPADYGKPFKANYLGQNKFEVFCRKPQDPSNVIKLNAEVQKYGLEWEDDFGFWFLDSPGAVYLSWKYGEIPLPKAIDQARNPGHIHDLVTDYLTNSPHAAEIQKIATEYFGFTADGEMNEGVAEGGEKYKVKSIGHDAKGDYYISPSTGKKVYKSGVKVGDHENPKTGEHKGVAEKFKTGPAAHFTPKDKHVKIGQFVGGEGKIKGADGKA
jgi:hypothetical protein